MYKHCKGGRPTGELVFDLVYGQTVATTAYARYPLKFVCSTKASDRICAWVATFNTLLSWPSRGVRSCALHTTPPQQYALGYGGGAVCGDDVTVSCRVGEGCTAAITTQGSTKVFKRGDADAESGEHESVPLRWASQSLVVRAEAGSLLAVVPDPVTCFQDASFRQYQQFLLARGASLVLVDWMTSGRMSRGEGWAFSRLESRNEVMLQGPTAARDGHDDGWEPLVLDALVLEDLPGLSVRERMLGMNVVGVVILVGPRVVDTVSSILAHEAGKRSRFPPGLEPSRAVSTERQGGNKGRSSSGAAKAAPRADEKGPHRGGGKILCSVSPIEGSGRHAWCRGLVYRFAAERTEDARSMLHSLLLPLKGELGGRAPFSREGGDCRDLAFD